MLPMFSSQETHPLPLKGRGWGGDAFPHPSSSPDIEPDVRLPHGLEQSLERADLAAGKIIILRRTAKVEAPASEIHFQPLLHEPGEFLFGVQDALRLLFCQETIDPVGGGDQVYGIAFVQSRL